MTSTTADPRPDAAERDLTDVEVLIIGSGFSGLGTAIKLREQGHDDFVVLERGEDVGGTWWFNTYPGCACDVPSHLYSFSFAPNPDWSQTYSRQPEIRSYLQDCADRYGIRPFLRTGCNVEMAEWKDDERRWIVQTSRGTFRARMLVAGMGGLSEPNVPDIPGLDSFEGEMFHSARWNHDYDLRGKRVASIGTGASAIQYVPTIAPDVEHLTVFQRTPPWVMPHTNRKVTDLERRLYRAFPLAQKLTRGGIYAAREALVLGFVKRPRLMDLVEKLARAHIKRQVPDPELRRKVTPDYKIGCKRILPSDQWYPALARDNVELVASGVTEVRPHSVIAADGSEHEADAIVFGTGFSVSDMPVARQVRGREGKLLDEVWQGSPRAHLGTAVDGFPNFFILVGPNVGLGHSSMVYMIESQIAHVMDALRTMRERDAGVVEVRPEAVERFAEKVEADMQGTVWNSGCSSWYLDANGRNSALWPDWTFSFRRQSSTFDPADYRVEPGRAEVPA